MNYGNMKTIIKDYVEKSTDELHNYGNMKTFIKDFGKK